MSHQIHFGLFGAIVTEYADSTAYDEAGCPELYTDGGETAYETNILVFSSVYAVRSDLCTCNEDILNVETLVGETNAAREGAGAYGRCNAVSRLCSHQYSACYEFCAFEGSRQDSGLDYEVEITSDNTFDTDGIDHFPLVNGIYNPTIRIRVGYYRRLRLINTMPQYFIHYKFPAVEDCNVLLLGYDGVFFTFPRDLNEFHNELVLSSGSRGDILIKCVTEGEFVVVAIALDGQSQNDEDDFDDLERFGSGTKYFVIALWIDKIFILMSPRKNMFAHYIL